ncbi:hypothetical protein [Streptomyces sp. NPDC056491]|uniref:hypothetical protein n=1 Tax=Streptomyces sp. NPDC056491 TaxID=3345837 RepID=UPI0036C81EEB
MTPEEANALIKMFLSMTEEELLIVLRFGGFEVNGRSLDDRERIAVSIVRGMTKPGRRNVARAFVRAFAALPVQAQAALVAFLLALGIRPAGVVLPAPVPRVLTPQRGWHRLTPARAP